MFKTSVLLGMLMVCHAAPLRAPQVGDLERRIPGSIPASVKCGDQYIPKQRIEAALYATYTTGRSAKNKEYPALYFNLDRENDNIAPTPVLTYPAAVSAAKARTLMEQPIGLTGTWTDGPLKDVQGANLYRVIFDNAIRDAEDSYVGVIYHPFERNNRLLACNEVGPGAGPSPIPEPTITPAPTQRPTSTPTPRPTPGRRASPTPKASPIPKVLPSPAPAPKKPKHAKKPSTK